MVCTAGEGEKRKLRNNTLPLAIPAAHRGQPSSPLQADSGDHDRSSGKEHQAEEQGPSWTLECSHPQINPARDTNVNQLLAGQVTIHFHLHAPMDALFLPSQVEGKHCSEPGSEEQSSSGRQRDACRIHRARH